MTFIDTIPRGKSMSAADFPPLGDGRWGLPVEVERRNRIRASVWAYAYEIADNPIVSDFNFDRTVQAIRPRMTTGHPLLDEFFMTEFSPMTGMWIHRHPELHKIELIYTRYHKAVRIGA